MIDPIPATTISDDGETMLLCIAPEDLNRIRHLIDRDTTIQIGETKHGIVECWTATALDAGIAPGSWLVRIAK